MALIDLVNISAGIGKGITTSAGVDISYSLPAIAIVSAIITTAQHTLISYRKRDLEQGKDKNKLDDILDNTFVKKVIGGSKNTKSIGNKPFEEAVKAGTYRTVVSGVELATGFAIGYIGHKIYYVLTY